MKNVSGVILAGGANSRFGGETKSKMIVGGSSIISRMMNVLTEVFDEIIIVTNNPSEFEEFRKHKIVSDKYLKAGPLGGIHAAMMIASNPYIFVFGGDMPFISKDLIIKQIELFPKSKCDAFIPQIDSLNEPLHAIYSLTIFMRLDCYMADLKPNAIKDFLKKLRVTHFHPEDTPDNRRAFTNINTPSDLAEANHFLRKNSEHDS